MRRFRFVAVLLSLALLTLLVFSIFGGESAEAGGKDIKTKFNFVQNPALVDPVVPGRSGKGEFKLDGRDLDKLKFELNKVKASGLEPNAWYYLAVTTREVVGGDFGGAGGDVPVGFAVAGMARADDEGRLKFKGKGVLPNVFDDPVISGVTEWRIDQQIRQLGSGEFGNCNECILVCAPTTKVRLDGDKLVQVP